MRTWATDSLVQGIKVRMTSADLRAHLMARSSYHFDRKRSKLEALPSLKEAAERLRAQKTTDAAAVAQFNKGSVSNYRFDGDDAVAQVEADIEAHNNKAVYFAWLADHLFEVDYCLDRNDLVQLEIVKQ